MAFTDGPAASITPTIEGAWLHSAADPAGTALHLRYGRGLRGDELDVASGETLYAGRVHPMVDFGENETERVRVAAQVPNGPEYASTLARLRELKRSRLSLVYRDGRGRMMTGYPSGLRVDDQAWGALVSFVFTRTA